MNTRKKGKIAAILLSMAMVFTMMPMIAAPVYADSVTNDNGIKFELNSDENTASVTGFEGQPTEVTIPATVESGGVTYTVTSIGEYAFAGCQSLTSITIPESVTRLLASAFDQCVNLETVVFAEGSQLESIGRLVFRKTSLTTITIPGSVKAIDSMVFFDCNKLNVLYFCGTEAEWGRMARDYQWDGNIGLRVVCTLIEVPEGKTLTYNGEEQTGVAVGTGYTLSGTTSATNVGTYTATAALEELPDPNYKSEWADGTTDPKTISWKIKGTAVEVPSGKTLTYNGEEQTGVAAGTGYTLSGTTSATNVGTYEATAKLEDGYEWSDGTTEDKTIEWKIDKAVVKVTVPTGKTYTYNGKTQTGVAAGSNYTLSGTTKATNAGSYTTKATLKTDANHTYKWTDGTTAVKSITWKINKAVVKVAVPTGKTFTYNGKTQTGVAAGSNYTLSGTTKATNAGSYTAKATLKTSANYTYKWTDGKTAAKSIAWKINKANNPLAMKPKTATVKYKSLKKKAQPLDVTKVITFTKQLKDKKTYTLSTAKKGSKSFKKYFTVNKTTGKVTVKKGLKKGTYKVTVKVKALGNANYKASALKTVTFKVVVK